MTLDQALAELGVDRAATSEQARRAYLRLLKTRKPEVDPEGFKRLREAYELAKEVLDRRELPPEDGPGGEPPPVASTAHPASSPGSESAHETGPRPVDRPSHARWVAEAEALLEARDFRGGAKLVSAAYDAARLDVSVLAPAFPPTITLLLKLHETGQLDAAVELTRSSQRWLDASGVEAKVLRDRAGALWKIVTELSSIGEELSLCVRAAIVDLARGAPWDDVVERLDEHRRVRAMAAERDARIIASHPNLPSSIAFAAALRGQNAASPNIGKKHLSPRQVIALAALAVFVLSGVFSSGSSRKAAPPAAARAVGSGATAGPRPALASAMSLAHAVVFEARREGAASRVQQTLASASRALDGADCGGATAAIPTLSDEVAADAGMSTRLSSNVRDLEGRILEACDQSGAPTARDGGGR